ncbi:hypothetical protein EES46_30295 [Streptomyces sp. ADI98-10]|nr:hypothetical protein EES46_30295 [Streptomyces sp. ADI98-10]
MNRTTLDTPPRERPVGAAVAGPPLHRTLPWR